MKDIVHPACATPPVATNDPAKGNSRAVSARLEARSMSKAKGARSHDYRIGKIPNYVNQELSPLNRVLLELRPLAEIRDENIALRMRAGRQRAMKSNAAVVTSGIITFGTEAAGMFGSLTVAAQNAAFRDLAQTIAEKLNTSLESLVVHLDETTIHAHFMLRGYTDAGLALSAATKAGTTSALQDTAAEVMTRHCPGIERGHRKRDRLAAGASYAETLHRSVRELHEDLPAEIAARAVEVEALEGRIAELSVSVGRTASHLEKLAAKAALSEKEEKRRQVYSARLAKKEEELTALQTTLDAERRELAAREGALVEGQARLREETSAFDSEKETVKTERDEAEKLAQVARDRMEKAKEKEKEVEEKAAQFDAALAAVESVVGEIAAGTMAVNDAGKIVFAEPEPLRAMPRALLNRLMPPVLRLVRLIDETQKRAHWLERMMVRVNAFLGRDDLAEEARHEAEELRRDWDAE